MEALRLIKTVRHALVASRATGDILHQAWQSGLLTEAVGARIGDHDGEEFATLGQLLSEAGSHAASCLRPPPDRSRYGPGGVLGSGPGDWSGPPLVERLTELGELEPVLTELAGLLAEAGENLVVLACGAETESLYWACIDGLDANSECRDLVAELLREQRRTTAPDGASPEDGEAAQDADDPADTAALTAAAAFPEPEEEESAAAGGARREEPRLVVPLGPPVPAARAQAWAESSGSLVGAVSRRSESSPARSVLIEASSSCICSSSDLVVTGAPSVGVPGVGGSVQGSDMRGPLQLGGAG
ncbi:hypothetical protein TR51_23550 [Kitasatospora griseola]|uniref:Uncharacterized protein n=1 Tax=Kitasatospora griseola TaxID=2064 RepID=A0A0D0PI42_KITGR|nr:DUF6099 family protein [Kitasatospora griseola]KIQ62139.1 hypothetical protein TR51_23550 [Kitasatospora griseola]